MTYGSHSSALLNRAAGELHGSCFALAKNHTTPTTNTATATTRTTHVQNRFTATEGTS